MQIVQKNHGGRRLVREQANDAVTMRVERFAIKDRHPRIVFDDFPLRRFRDVRKKPPPLFVPLKARHPLRVRVREFWRMCDLDPIMEREPGCDDASSRAGFVIARGIGGGGEFERDSRKTFRCERRQAIVGHLFRA